MDSITNLTLQALGFATGAALCAQLGALHLQASRSSRSTSPWAWLWIAGFVWTAGSFAKCALLLGGLTPLSRAVALAQVFAWSSTCTGPLLVARLADHWMTGAHRARPWLHAIARISSAVLSLLWIELALEPDPSHELATLPAVSFYVFLGHVLCYGLPYLSHRLAHRQQHDRAPLRTPSHWFIRIAIPLAGLQLLAVLLAIHQSAQPGSFRLIVAVFTQQWTIPWALLIAALVAETQHADVVLKRSLRMLLSVVMATLAAWWLLPPGLPLMLMSLGGAALMLTAPWLARCINGFVDRVVLQRPDYARLLQLFADTARRCSSNEELLAHAAHTISDALELDASFGPAATARTDARAIARIQLPAPRPSPYVLQLTGTTQARTLMQEEFAFLDAMAVEISRGLVHLEFERERRELQLREQRLQHLLTEAELKALRAQVDPHFLFNTLNTIVDLIATSPVQAEAMTERLAECFRYTLLRQDRAFSSLDDEFEFVRHYLDIEQVRFGTSLRVELQRDPAIDQEPVPSLILQPLVENAVRHGLGPKPGGGNLSITARPDGEFLCLQVADDGVGMRADPDRNSGIGLNNVRERLNTLYRGAARMIIGTAAQGRGTCITLLLPRHGH